MNFFQEQLKAIFTSSKFCEDVQYIGRAAYIPLDNGVIVKANYIKANIYNRYDALRLSAIADKKTVDTLILHFSDYFAESNGYDKYPDIWEDGGDYEWYIQPVQSDFESLAEAADKYICLIEQQLTENKGMNMSY